MCTVTYLPLPNNDFILTSNRDEHANRITLPPKKYVENDVEMLFPKDELAGGTWIGLSSKNRLVCVLNGAFVKHKRKESYKKSRGLIAKDILKTDNLSNYIQQLDLNLIEPFTMVIVDWNAELTAFEFIWNASEKHFIELKNEPKIWSSATLYSEEMKIVRSHWFEDWKNNYEFSSESILKFHHSEIGDKEQSILMKRGVVETVSITSVKKENNSIEMYYEDVINNEITTNYFNQQPQKVPPL